MISGVYEMINLSDMAGQVVVAVEAEGKEALEIAQKVGRVFESYRNDRSFVHKISEFQPLGDKLNNAGSGSISRKRLIELARRAKELASEDGSRESLGEVNRILKALGIADSYLSDLESFDTRAGLANASGPLAKP